jgi:hypothetical protein
VTYMIKEFWPDLRKLKSHKHEPVVDSASPNNP